ncbi:MAG: DUF2846 domain-containing protein [Gallionellaceae bacterium]
MLNHKILLLALATFAITGCSSIPMATKEQDATSKQFKTPTTGLSGVYIYRNGAFGGATKKTVSLDRAPLGETLTKTFFHREIKPGPHIISTKSEFGDNELSFDAVEGENYYFRHYMKLGVIVGGAGIEAVNEQDGMKGVMECEEAR